MVRALIRVLAFTLFFVAGFPSVLARGATGLGDRARPMSRFMRGRIRDALGARHARQADAIERAIARESERHELDPLLVMAVIQSESGFRARKRGTHGEIGLMQLKPATARWVARLSGLRWRGKRALFGPGYNIRLGTAYIAMLRDRYQASRGLYLAAYNMGCARLDRCLRQRIVPSQYARRVLGHRERYLSELSLTLTAST